MSRGLERTRVKMDIEEIKKKGTNIGWGVGADGHEPKRQTNAP